MSILDYRGNPIDTGRLKESQTASIATLKNQWHDINTAQGLSPARLAQLFTAAAVGNLASQSELFEDMLERDAHLYAEMDKRKSAPLNMDWSIVPPRNASFAEKKLAGYAEEVLRDLPDWEDIIKALMDGVGHGFAALEIQWQRDGNEWLPSFSYRPQSWFTLPLDRSEIRLRDGSMNGAQLQPFGWVMHQHGLAKTGYLGRMPLYRVLAWPFLYKLYGLSDFAEFLETYGLPIIIGKFPVGATTAQQNSLLKSVRALGHDARGIMPADMQIEINEVAASGVSQHMTIVDWADKAQSKCILGGTLSSQADGKTSTNALGQVHDVVRRDIAKQDCLQIAGTITRDIIYPLLLLNKSGIDSLRRCPRLVFDSSEAEDLAIYADSLPKLVSIGMKIPSRYAHDKLKIPQPEGDESVLGAPAPPVSHPVSAALAAEFTPPRFTEDQQVIEDLADSVLLNLGSPVSHEAISDAIKAARSYEDLADRLAVLLGSDSKDFEAVLARATFAADVMGFVHATA